MNTTYQANKELVQEIFKAIDNRDKERFMSLLHPDHRCEVTGENESLDREGHWLMAIGHGAIFSDMKHTPEFQIAEDNTVVSRGVITGTNDGPIGDIPATGKTVKVPFINISKIVDGKICGMFSLFDSNAEKKQLFGE